MKKRGIELLLLLFSLMVVFLVAAEVLAVVIRENPDKYLGPTSAYWQYKFVTSGQMWDTHVVHPTRGWTTKPNVHVGPPFQTTNNRGHRSTKDYIYQPDKFTILVVGDSFTFGATADDGDVFTDLMQAREPRFHVLNLGVMGYGTDQMYITVRETIEEYKPQLVVFAFLSEDMDRSMLTFREYRKPRFVLSPAGELTLTNTPVGDEKDVMAELKRHYRFPFGPFRVLLESRAEQKARQTLGYGETVAALNMRLFEEANKCTQDHGAEFLLVHLANGIFLDDPSAYDSGEDFLGKFQTAHATIPCLETRKAFLDAHKQWFDGHYDRSEAEVVANLIVKRIRELTSWRTYEQKPKQAPETSH